MSGSNNEDIYIFWFYKYVFMYVCMYVNSQLKLDSETKE